MGHLVFVFFDDSEASGVDNCDLIYSMDRVLRVALSGAALKDHRVRVLVKSYRLENTGLDALKS